MEFGTAIKTYWVNYANFKGRTSKATFWWTILFLALAGSVISIIFPAHYETNMMNQFDPFDDNGQWVESVPSRLWSLATFLPSLALLVRRLHDTGRSGHKAWFVLLPIVGWIMLLVWVLKPTDLQPNAFGAPEA
jgi:uncharacterized membrane protein YhaH (DUF805 family)